MAALYLSVCLTSILSAVMTLRETSDTAAEGMEGNQRKVIVERLEAVKSKNPVFTWC